MKYLLSIVLLALIGVTTPKKTTTRLYWGMCVCKAGFIVGRSGGAAEDSENNRMGCRKVRVAE